MNVDILWAKPFKNYPVNALTCPAIVSMSRIKYTSYSIYFVPHPLWVLTPELHQPGQDDEAGLLGDGVGEVNRSLDDGEQNLLNVLRP